MIRIDCRDISGDPGASAQIREAHDCLATHGYAILDHVLPEVQIRSLNAEFDDRHARYHRVWELDGTAKVGNRRYLVPLDLSGGFGNPSVFANPIVMALVREGLQPEAVLEAFGVIVSLPGSKAQHLHSDSPPLFAPRISPLLPAYALNIGLPIMSPTIPPGACVLWDFSLFHRGTPNSSGIIRPLIYAAYARPWYRGPANYDKARQRRLSFAPEFLDGLSDDNRRLFAHVVPAGA